MSGVVVLRTTPLSVKAQLVCFCSQSVCIFINQSFTLFWSTFTEWKKDLVCSRNLLFLQFNFKIFGMFCYTFQYYNFKVVYYIIETMAFSLN